MNHPLLTTEGWACLDPETAEKEHEVKAILLRDDMEIITTTGAHRIKEIQQIDGAFTVYNLEVPYYHTYLADNMVAHNARARYF